MRLWTNAPRWSQVLVILALNSRPARGRHRSTWGILCNDDGSGYLVFPQKMLATHHFAADPFSDRRVISSLGGSYLLQRFVIAATSLSNIGMADRTLGLIFIFFALLELGIGFGLSPPRIAAMELIVFIPQETFNLTFTILPIALFLAMIWIIYLTPDQEEHQRWRSAMIAGIIGGGILSLKSTFLPYIGAVALIPYIFLFWRKKRLNVDVANSRWAAAVVTVAAWMVAMKHNSGTYLFPILGHGFDYSSYRLFPSMPRFSSSHAVEKCSFRQLPSCSCRISILCRNRGQRISNESRHFAGRRLRDHSIQLRKRRRLHLAI